MGSFSIWHWLIVLLIVMLIFGTKKLRNMGGDVGGAVKSFKDAVAEGKNGDAVVLNTIEKDTTSTLIESAVTEAPVVKAAPKKRAPAKPKATTSSVAKNTVTKKPVVKKAAVKKTSAK